MIDELVLEQLLDELGREIDLPVDGAERVVHELGAAARAVRRPSPRITRALMIAAVIVVVAAIGLLMKGSSPSSTARLASPAPRTAPPTTIAGTNGDFARRRAARPVGEQGANGPAGAKGATGATGAVGLPVTTPVTSGGPLGSAAGRSPSGPVDGAQIVKTGSLDLEVPKDTLRPTVNRVTGVATSLGGYVADSKTSYDTAAATAQVTIRVPVANFEAATDRLDGLPGVRVLGDSENGTDVTAQSTNLQAQLTAATGERDALLGVLAQADNIGDILAVRDRISAVQSEIDQLQGRINVLDDQATFSSIAITLTEKQVVKPKAVVVPAKPPTGLSKAWKDARQGFSNSIEWLIARSGGALIVLLAALALIFGLRYLYPIVRRALL